MQPTRLLNLRGWWMGAILNLSVSTVYYQTGNHVEEEQKHRSEGFPGTGYVIPGCGRGGDQDRTLVVMRRGGYFLPLARVLCAVDPLSSSSRCSDLVFNPRRTGPGTAQPKPGSGAARARVWSSAGRLWPGLGSKFVKQTKPKMVRTDRHPTTSNIY